MASSRRVGRERSTGAPLGSLEPWVVCGVVGAHRDGGWLVVVVVGEQVDEAALNGD